MRLCSLVRIKKEWECFEIFTKHKMNIIDNVFLFLGEIPNMKEHCVVIGFKTGMIYIGYHTERFEEIPEDET